MVQIVRMIDVDGERQILLRQWAIEQAIRAGFPPCNILREAEGIERFVMGPGEPKDAT